MYIYNMKRLFTLLSISLITLIGFSAKAQVKSYIGLYGGISNAVSNFGQSDYYNNQGGFAKRGATFALDGAYYFYKKLAIGATVSFQDQGELNNNDVNTLAAGYTSSFKADQSTVTSVGRFHSLNVLLGPQYSFEFHQFILDLRASAGIIKVFSTPDITTSLVGVPTQTASFEQKSASTTIMGYGGNVGLRWKFSDNWCLGIKGAYVGSQGYTVTNSGHTTETTVGRLVTKQPVSEIQTTIGLTVSL
jgi:hypothetical protein